MKCERPHTFMWPNPSMTPRERSAASKENKSNDFRTTSFMACVKVTPSTFFRVRSLVCRHRPRGVPSRNTVAAERTPGY